MRSSLRAFVTAPMFDDDDKTRISWQSHIVILATIFLNIVSIVISSLFNPIHIDLTLNFVALLIQFIFLYLVKKGYVKQVIFVFSLMGWLVITDAAQTVDGIVNPIVALYVIPILLTGLLVSVRAGLTFTALAVITTLVFVWAARAGLYIQADGQIELGTRLANYLSLFGFTGLTVYLSASTIQMALTRLRASETALRERNRQLEAESEKRELAQQELAASEFRWRLAVEGSDTGVWDMNLETRVTFRSPRYLELLGYSPESLKDLPELTSLVHPDDLPRVLAKRETYFREPTKPYEDELRVRCADGTYKWFLYKGNIIQFRPDGKPLRFAGTLTDIHARKQLDEALRLSEQEYHRLFDDNPNPMWVFEKATERFIAVNDAAVALYGYPRDEFLQMSVRDIYPESDLPQLESVLNDALPILSTPDIWRHRTREGKILYVELSGHETVFQGKPARLVLVRDMTVQKETEESLRSSQELFGKVFETVPVGVSITRLVDGRIISINPYMAAMLDYAPEDMIGHTGAELGIIEAVVRTTQMENLKNLNPVPTTFEMDYKLKARTGRNVDALMLTQQVKTEGEDAFLSIVVDVTALKRTEREKAQIEILQSELDKQREVVELKERFISSVSHEFRSPLTIMLTGTGILRLHDGKLSSEQRVERLAKIETQIHYLSELLDRILTIGKARAGKFQFNPQAIDIVHFCRVLFEDFQLTDNNQHQFVFETSGDFSRAKMDEKLLQHILMNLISNAVKYSPNDKEIKLAMTRDDDHVVIEISDQGIGIPEEEQHQVFEPFFRSQNAASVKGTGLGLTITKESVEAHNGSITWQSKVGRGTTFVVRLPGGFQPIMMLA